jgi:hypothetical protein
MSSSISEHTEEDNLIDSNSTCEESADNQSQSFPVDKYKYYLIASYYRVII